MNKYAFKKLELLYVPVIIFCGVKIAKYRRFDESTAWVYFVWGFLIALKLVIDKLRQLHSEKKQVYEKELYYKKIDELNMQYSLYVKEAQYRDTHYDQSRKIRDEIHIALDNIQKLIQSQEYPEANRLMQQLEDDIRADGLIYCKNVIINILIQDKVMSVQDRSIEFYTCLKFDDSIPVNKLDLCRLFHNLIDNALEACELEEGDGKREVILEAGIVKNYFLIKVKNTYNKNALSIKGNRLGTNKKDKVNHGFGIAIVREIAEKYNGRVVFKAGEKYFLAVVSLELENSEMQLIPKEQ